MKRACRIFLEACRVVVALPGVEVARRRVGTGRAIVRFRDRGRHAPSRNAQARGDLQRVIRVLDRFVPSGPNCFRRVLLEVALDRSAASERVMLGLKAGLARRSGHAWLEMAGPAPGQYDTQLSV
jgi:hypothetical protein